MQPLILRDLCKKGSCDPPPPPPHTGHCGHTKVALYRGPVYRAGQGIKRSHHKPTVWSSLSIPWHCLGNLGLRTIFIKCNIFILSTRLPFLLQHFVTGAVSHPAVVGRRTHKASSLVDDVLELLLFHQAAQGDGKAGGRQTEQRGELLRLTIPTPPSPYLPKLSAPPVTICEIWFSSFCEEREKHYTPLPPPP